MQSSYAIRINQILLEALAKVVNENVFTAKILQHNNVLHANRVAFAMRLPQGAATARHDGSATVGLATTWSAAEKAVGKMSLGSLASSSSA